MPRSLLPIQSVHAPFTESTKRQGTLARRQALQARGGQRSPRRPSRSCSGSGRSRHAGEGRSSHSRPHRARRGLRGEQGPFPGRVRWLREGREGTGGEGFSVESRGTAIQKEGQWRGPGRGGEGRGCSIWKQRREWPGVGMRDPGGRGLAWLVTVGSFLCPRTPPGT